MYYRDKNKDNFLYIQVMSSMYNGIYLSNLLLLPYRR